MAEAEPRSAGGLLRSGWTHGLAARIAALAVIFGAELTIATVLLDGDSIHATGAVTQFVRNWGPWISRGGVVFAALFATFAYLKCRSGLAQISDRLSRIPLHRGLLAGHLLAVAVFAVLAPHIYGGAAPDASLLSSTQLVAVAWIMSGIAAVALGAFALVPLPVWMEILHRTGLLWLYTAGAVLLAVLATRPSRSLWEPVRQVTFRLTMLILRPILPGVTANPEHMIIRAPHFAVTIAPECSGLEGMGLMVVFGMVWLWLFRHECRFPRALALIPIGVVVVFLLNSVRLAVLILIGNAGAKQIAIGGFHSQAGWISFNLVAFGLCVAARRMPAFSIQTASAAERGQQADNPPAAYLIPFLAILGAGMLARAASGGFEWLYPIRFVAAAAALWMFRKRYREIDWRCGWLGAACGVVIFALWIALDRWHGGAGTLGFPAALAAAPAAGRVAWIALRVLAAVVTVPVAEELAFRGFLMRRLASADFESMPLARVTWVPLVISSVAFGLLHGERWLAGSLAALAFGWVAVRKGRLGEAVLAHAVTNALLAAYVLGGGNWGLW